MVLAAPDDIFWISVHCFSQDFFSVRKFFFFFFLKFPTVGTQIEEIELFDQNRINLVKYATSFKRDTVP
jgi:hypothetical protein